MPRYEYHCKNCDKAFIIEASIKDKRDNVACSTCSGNDVYRVFAQVGLTSLPTRGANSLSKSSSPSTSTSSTSSTEGTSSDSSTSTDTSSSSDSSASTATTSSPSTVDS